MKNVKHEALFSTHITDVFKKAKGLLAEYPQSAYAILKVSAHEAKAKKKRKKWLAKDINVPPLLIVSTTKQCNLRCKGCYSANICREQTDEMHPERVSECLNEASSAGCSVVLLAGGEPLLSPNWLHPVAEHDELLGLVFTNGTLFNKTWIQFFASHRNMIALFSVEGSPEKTDSRRGSGVSEKIGAVMRELHKENVPFGISITTGSHNIDEVTATEFILPYIELGCRLIIHVEYVPTDESKELTALSVKEKNRLSAYCTNQSKKSKAIFIAFPGNEAQYGGCLAAGRGFLHIAASGALEPCPFAPYTDRNLNDMSFLEALSSPLLKAVRAESHTLHEDSGGCSLRKKEAWPETLLEKE